MNDDGAMTMRPNQMVVERSSWTWWIMVLKLWQHELSYIVYRCLCSILT